MKKEFMPSRRRIVFGMCGSAAALLAAPLRAIAATNYSITARSGQELPCNSYYRFDANGKDWPVTLQITKRPTNGTLRTASYSESRQTPAGQRVVRVTRMYYKSRAGYTGSDSFAYRRITADPTDPKRNEEYIVAVTVR